MHSPQALACARLVPSTFMRAAGWPLALAGQFVFVLALVALSGPGRIDIVDGQTRYEVARSLVDHGDSMIRDEAAWFATYKGRDGKRYTDYRIPQSALGVLAIMAADATGPVSEMRRQFFFTLIGPCLAALLAVVYTLWFRALGHGPGASVAWGTAGIFCTPSWYYATSTFDDMIGTTAIVVAVAVMWLARERRVLLGAAVAGLALAWAVNCKPPLAFFALAVLAAGYRPQVSLRRQILPAVLVCAGVLAGVAFYKVYHAYKFPPGTTDTFAEYEKQFGPWTTTNPLPGLTSLAFSPSCGILFYCPTLLLSWRGWSVWRQRYRLFCLAVVAPSLLFVLFVAFLPFFKGEPCWGPRYLTPVFALWWVFAPTAAAKVSTRAGLLTLGCVVQLLALSVDPMRLFLQVPLDWNYYNYAPWLTFDAQTSHLVQRPREIIEVLQPPDPPAPNYSPAPVATHAGCLATGGPTVTSMVGLMACPLAPAPLNVTLAWWPTAAAQRGPLTHGSLPLYHIYNAPRPWFASQWYLAEERRPVDLVRTIEFLVACGLGGLVLMLAGVRLRGGAAARGLAIPGAKAPAAVAAPPPAITEPQAPAAGLPGQVF
jgi:hypothetical protein